MRWVSLGILGIQRNGRTSSSLYVQKIFIIYYHSSRKIKIFFFFLALVHPDNTLLGFLTYSTVDALRCIELPRGEFLLVFHTLAVFVDSQGRKSRDREIMYPAVPTAVGQLNNQLINFLLIFQDI